MGESKFAGIFQQSIAEAIATPERPTALKALGRPPGKRSDPAFKQYSVLLRKHTHRAVDRILRDQEDGPDISELIQQLLEEWLDRQGK
jgi:hypothetical protein